MKRVLTFISLKIAEVLGVVFVPWGLGLMWQSQFPLSYIASEFPHPWVAGFVTILATIVVGVLTFLLILGNWEWAKKLTK